LSAHESPPEVKKASAWGWETVQNLFKQGVGDPKASAPFKMHYYPHFHDWIAGSDQVYTNETNIGFVNVQYFGVAQGGSVYEFGPIIQVFAVENGTLTHAEPIDMQILKGLGIFPPMPPYSH
jgi:hypothetical protein